MVEQLTLNQLVEGSSPSRCMSPKPIRGTIRRRSWNSFSAAFSARDSRRTTTNVLCSPPSLRRKARRCALTHIPVRRCRSHIDINECPSSPLSVNRKRPTRRFLPSSRASSAWHAHRYRAHHSTLGRRDALARDVAAGYLSCARKPSQRTGNKASPFRDRNS